MVFEKIDLKQQSTASTVKSTLYVNEGIVS